MRILICGAGNTARELIRQLGDDWQISLVEKSHEKLLRTASISPNVENTYTEDASSPVVLKKIGLADFDYVVALTDDDEVNLAIAREALRVQKVHTCIRLRTNMDTAGLREAGVHVVQANRLVAGQMFHFLQDPRIRISPLMQGPASVMEVRASDHIGAVGKRAVFFFRDNSRLVGIIRNDKLIFPQSDAVIRADDRLIILGDPDIFHSVCELLECEHPHFPLAYGHGMLLAVGTSEDGRMPSELNEGLYLAQSTQIKSVTLLNPPDGVDYSANLNEWPQTVTLESKPGIGDIGEAIRTQAGEGNYGLVVIPPVEESLLRFLARPTYVSLADDIGRPLLVAKGSMPYGKILVPFSGTPMSELALEVAVDLTNQFKAEITVAIVGEPAFITGADVEKWQESCLSRIHELAHIHKMEFNEIVRRGNPVKEIIELGKEHDLLVVGSTNRHRGILTPNIGEELARTSACSVLIMTR